MNTQSKRSQQSNLSHHGVITELGTLLNTRHWAQRLKLYSRQAARNMMLGNSSSRFRGRGMEFEEVRRYQPGDDIRTIDWKVSARAQGTYTKLFCEERERPCHIILDQRSRLFFGSSKQFKSVLAAEIAAAISWAALSGGDRVGGQVFGDTLELDTRARRSRRTVLSYIHDIHQLNTRLSERFSKQTAKHDSLPDKTTSIAQSLQECDRITRPGTAIFIISDFHDFDEVAAKALSTLSKHSDISMIQVTDALEEQLPISGNVAISNGLLSSRVNVSKKLQQKYLLDKEAQQQLLKTSVTRAKALFTKIDTSISAQRALMNIFGR
ncbi:MAG: DUF58 domain-containing protein [Pseudomonadales bacterium]